MITAMIVLFFVSLTYLIIDHRHYNEIQEIETAKAVEIHLASALAYSDGVAAGSRSRMSRMSMSTLN